MWKQCYMCNFNSSYTLISSALVKLVLDHECYRTPLMVKEHWFREWLDAFNKKPLSEQMSTRIHDDVIKWKHAPRYWSFVRGIHWSPVNSPHKGQWRGALMFSLICVWINDWVNNREAGDLRRYRAHYDVIVRSTTPCEVIRIQWINSLIHGDDR